MKRRLLALTILISAVLPAAAADYQQALKTLKGRLDPSLFSSIVLSPQKQIILKATDKYISLPASGRYVQVSGALIVWRLLLRPAGPPNLILSVRWSGGGELWLLKETGSPVKIDEWADTRLPFTPEKPNSDRYFGYLGGQYMRDSEAGNMTAFNGRLGKTFMQGRFDAAALYGYSKLGESGLSSYGLTGRVLFPMTEKMGWNAGGSFTRSAPSQGEAVNRLAALAGVSFYLPGGSFDITTSLGNKSAYSLLIGYTMYLSRK